ncbi:MAG: hypothetical protein ACW96X_11120, partial [Promethearchaeota archaeon]
MHKNKQKYTILLMVFLTCSILGLSLGGSLNLSTTYHETKNEIDFKTLKTSSILTDFQINDIGTSNWTWAKLSGYCTGSGTSGDPYLIENQIFEYSIGPGNCLEILNSRKYFIL